MNPLGTLLKTLAATTLALFASASIAAVDANQGSQAELESVKSIGPSLAGRILDERKKTSFKDWQDMIDRVKGVGPGNAAKFSAQGLTVNGTTFNGAVAAASPAKVADKAADKAATKPPAAKPADAKEAKAAK